MTLHPLQWLVVSAYLEETDDMRYRVRKSLDSVTGDWQYRAFQTGPHGSERLLGGYASMAEAKARCTFHAFPSETHFPETEDVR